MRILSVMVLLSALLLAGCAGNSASALQEIESLQTKFDEVNTGNDLPNEATVVAAKALITALKQYPEQFPNDTACARMLYRAAGKQELLGQTNEAIATYEQIRLGYLEHELAPVSFYRIGYLYEMVLRDFNRARQRYTAFAEQYPEHPLAEKMDLQLEYLGREDELLEAILEQNAE